MCFSLGSAPLDQQTNVWNTIYTIHINKLRLQQSTFTSKILTELQTEILVYYTNIQISRWRSTVMQDKSKARLLWKKLSTGCIRCVTRWPYCTLRSRISTSVTSGQEIQGHLSTTALPCSWMFSRACTMCTTSMQPDRQRSWWFFTTQTFNRWKMSKQNTNLVKGAKHLWRLLSEPVHSPKRNDLELHISHLKITK